jgi:hypothetical protein
MWELRNHKAYKLQYVQPTISQRQRDYLQVPSQNVISSRTTQQRIGSNQIITSNAVIRGNSITNINPNIFAREHSARAPSILAVPHQNQERPTSIQKTINTPLGESTNRTALGDISNRTIFPHSVTKSPSKLKRTSSSKTLSINQINMMHKHLIGTKTSLNDFNVKVKHSMNAGGNLTKKSSASLVRPTRQHVVYSWIQLSKLLRKLLKLLDNLTPKSSELVLFDQPDILT